MVTCSFSVDGEGSRAHWIRSGIGGISDSQKIACTIGRWYYMLLTKKTIYFASDFEVWSWAQRSIRTWSSAWPAFIVFLHFCLATSLSLALFLALFNLLLANQRRPVWRKDLFSVVFQGWRNSTLALKVPLFNSLEIDIIKKTFLYKME